MPEKKIEFVDVAHTKKAGPDDIKTDNKVKKDAVQPSTLDIPSKDGRSDG